MRTNKGFTLIELIVVIVVLGILAAVAIPKYVDLTSQAKDSASKGFEGSVKTAFAFYLGNNKGAYPTVTQLTSYVQGSKVATHTLGVKTNINAATSSTYDYYVPTYTDDSCTTPTANITTDLVKCVGTVTVCPGTPASC